MEVLFKIFQEYGWWGILGIVICIGLFWSSKFVSKKLTANMTSGLEKIGADLTEKLADQNKALTNTIMDQQKLLIENLIHHDKEKEENHAQMMNEKMSLSQDINTSLKDMMNIHNSQRAFILEFQNSAYNLSGIPFAKYNCTYECYERGLTQLAVRCKDLPFSQLANVVATMIKKKVSQLVYNDISELEETNRALYDLLIDDGAKAIIYNALYDKDNQFFGLLALEYHKEVDLNNVNLDQIRLQCAEIISILNLRYKYNSVGKP
jgi:hypothetical protein